MVFLPFISAVPEAGNPANPTVPWKWLPEKERALQHQQLFGFHGVPLHFSGPRSRKSSKSEGALEMVSAKGADSTKSTAFGLLWGSLHFSGPRSRKSSISEGALEMASAKGADSTKSTVFGLLWCSLHFGGPRSRKSRKSEGAFEWLPQKERSSLHFGGPRSRKSSKSEGALEMAAGNPANPKVPWKWLPEKERALQHQQLFGFYGVPLHFGGSRSLKSSKPEGALEMALQNGQWRPRSRKSMKSKRGLGNGFRKRSGLYKINNFWAFCGVPSISAVPEAGNPANPKVQNQQLLGFCGVPSMSAVPEAGNPANPKEYKIDNF